MKRCRCGACCRDGLDVSADTRRGESSTGWAERKHATAGPDTPFIARAGASGKRRPRTCTKVGLAAAKRQQRALLARSVLRQRAQPRQTSICNEAEVL